MTASPVFTAATPGIQVDAVSPSPVQSRDPGGLGHLDSAHDAETVAAPLRARSRRPQYGALIVTTVCVVFVALWTVRALRDGLNSDMGLAWLAGGDLTWRTGRPDALFSWTGTPLLAAIMALISRVVSATPPRTHSRSSTPLLPLASPEFSAGACRHRSPKYGGG